MFLNKVFKGTIKMEYEIIDFHTHPFISNVNNICSHISNCNMSPSKTFDTMKKLGVCKICGAVIENAPLRNNESWWDRVTACNLQAIKLKEIYGDFYMPGFHVHPYFIEESIREIDKMDELGIKLIGELVPYMMGYDSYNNMGLHKIIDYATEKDMVISLHTSDDDDLDSFVDRHPDTIIVAAHPRELQGVLRHISRMKKYPNYYIDLSGTGLFRHGMLRRVIDEVGYDRILYGSDFPTCNPAMFVGGVALDELIMENEKKAIFADNAKRILKL